MAIVSIVPSVQCAEFLRKQRFVLATEGGVAVSSMSETNSIGLLLPLKWWQRLLRFRHEFVGVLYLGPAEDGWSLSVFGSQHLDRMWQVAEELQAAYDVKSVEVRLVDESSRCETIPWEPDF